MSSIFLAVNRSSSDGESIALQDKVRKLAMYLNPGMLDEKDIYIKSDNLSGFYLTSLHSGIQYHESNVCCGLFTEIPDRWWESQNIPPDASFLMTLDAEFCKIHANLVASRSIWYYYDKTQLLISSSQRAIVSWLGSFENNPQATSWMLATGNLGPGNSWDRRIKHLAAAETISLNRSSWTLSSSLRNRSIPRPFSTTQSELKEELSEKLEHVFSGARLLKSSSTSILTLSGGYDSRVVLYYLVKNGLKVPAATWGLTSAENEEETDSQIAKLVAKRLDVDHRYFPTDFKGPSFEPLLDNFLKLAEGRLDHINSFMDGLQMWQQLFSQGYRNVIRADEVFGWLPSRTEQDVRISLDYHRMEDNSNMVPLINFDLEPQNYPENFRQLPEESLDSWRDRLYREFRLPVVLTALHDLVQPYMEVVNPLLHDDLILFSQRLPDHLRTSKLLYSKHVIGLLPDIPIARKASIPEPAAILKSARIVGLMLDELSTQECRNLLGEKFIRWNQKNLNVNDNLVNTTNTGYGFWLKSHIPWQLKKLLRRDLIKYKADFNQLAFRAVIATRMHRMLKNDATALRKIESGFSKETGNFT